MLIILISVGVKAEARQDSEIRGRVIDKTTGEAVEYATVALFAADNTLIAGTSTGSDGSFSFRLGTGTYRLTATMLGYLDLQRELELLPAGTSLELMLEPDSRMLTGASVTSKVPLLKIKMDRMVVNVAQSAFAASSDGLELLRKSPGVVIDSDGNVTLNGKKVSIWLDGRPSYLDGKALETLLKSTSGTSIDRIELIEHPGAKYDAQGEGGIINIKTRKGAMQGLSGTLGANGGGMSFKSLNYNPLDANAHFNLAYRTDKSYTSVNSYLSRADYAESLLLDTFHDQEEGSRFRQLSDDFTGMSAKSYQLKIGHDRFLDPRNTLGFIITVPGSIDRTPKDSPLNRTATYLDGQLTAMNVSEVYKSHRNPQAGANLNYTHVFAPERNAELTLNADYFFNRLSTHAKTDVWDAYPGNEGEHLLLRNIESLNDIDIVSAKADYQTVLFGNSILEAGAKWALSRTSNGTSRTESGAMASSEETAFGYREHVAAAYVSYSGRLFGGLNLMAGLRAEYTNSFGDWKSAGSTSSDSYVDFFPSLHLGWSSGERLRHGLSYTRRINRPHYRHLNPIEEYVDAHTYTVGNPQLKPEYVDNLSFMTSFGEHFALMAEYQHTANLIVQVPYISAGAERKCLKMENMSSNNRVAAVLNISALPLTKWLQFSGNIGEIWMANRMIDRSFDEGGFFTQAYANFTFVLPAGFTMELEGSYQGSLTWGYFLIHPKYRADFGAKKSFLDGRLNASIKFTDLFRTSSEDLDIYDPFSSEIISTMKQKLHDQRIVVGLSWSFGSGSKSRQRKVGTLDETSRISTQGAGF